MLVCPLRAPPPPRDRPKSWQTPNTALWRPAAREPLRPTDRCRAIFSSSLAPSAPQRPSARASPPMFRGGLAGAESCRCNRPRPQPRGVARTLSAPRRRRPNTTVGGQVPRRCASSRPCSNSSSSTATTRAVRRDRWARPSPPGPRVDDIDGPCTSFPLWKGQGAPPTMPLPGALAEKRAGRLASSADDPGRSTASASFFVPAFEDSSSAPPARSRRRTSLGGTPGRFLPGKTRTRPRLLPSRSRPTPKARGRKPPRPIPSPTLPSAAFAPPATKNHWQRPRDIPKDAASRCFERLEAALQRTNAWGRQAKFRGYEPRALPPRPAALPRRPRRPGRAPGFRAGGIPGPSSWLWKAGRGRLRFFLDLAGVPTLYLLQARSPAAVFARARLLPPGHLRRRRCGGRTATYRSYRLRKLA